MKKLCLIFTAILLFAMLAIGFVSLVDVDPTVSLVENRTLATRPAFSIGALLNGSYLQELDVYYADTFPFREQLMKLNKKLNGFYYYSGENNTLILPGANGAEQGGASLDDFNQATGQGGNAADTPEDGAAGTPENPLPDPPEVEKPGVTTPADDTEKIDADAPHDSGWENNETADYTGYGSIIIIGDQAMEVPSEVPSAITKYAESVSALAEALPDVKVYSLLTPNAAEFYSPTEFHTGSHSQKAMIDSCYDQMSDAVTKVDIYSQLEKRTDQYIYFRTDHHWTARGAYWAYVAFCRARGFDAVSLEDFESGRYDEFVGSLYTFTSQYPQSEALWNNPDYVEYFLPIVESHAKYYADATLTNGIPISVVSTNISTASKQNKYLCFISGDPPVCVVETAVQDGPTCVVLKESYGNAFVPFLTSHYSRIIVIDPREFNHGNKPELDLKAFAAEQGVDDLIVIIYPFMINNATYISYLNALIGK